MIAGAVEIELGGDALWLLPQRAAFHAPSATLLVADAHLGKAAAFRRAGFAVPRGTTEADLARLAHLMRACDARRVVFLGDLVHDAAARRAASAAFIEWRAAHAEVEIVLVRGNHDRRAGDPESDWGLTIVAEPFESGAFALCHAPQPVPGRYAIAGHLHPGVRLNGRGRDTLRLPCFWLTPVHAVLPAFGAFTGLADIAPAAGDRTFVITDDCVTEAALG